MDNINENKLNKMKNEKGWRARRNYAEFNSLKTK